MSESVTQTSAASVLSKNIKNASKGREKKKPITYIRNQKTI